MGRLRVTSPNAGGETVVLTDKEKDSEPDMYIATCLLNEIHNRGQGDARGQYITSQENQNLPNRLPYEFIHCPFACGCPLRPSGQTQDNYTLGLQDESHVTNSQKT